MRSLSPTLLAAQRGASAEPYVAVRVVDAVAGVARASFTRLYTGAEPDGPVAAAVAGDGALLRARVSGGQLYVQRVPSPGPGSAFGTWTALDSAPDLGRVALAARGAAAYLFYVDPGDSRSVVWRRSADYGATWGARAPVSTPPQGQVVAVACAVRADGALGVFFQMRDPWVMYLVTWNGSIWSNPAGWPHTSAGLTGVAAWHQGDWAYVVCQEEPAGVFRVRAGAYGDGGAYPAGTWSPVADLVSTSQGAAMEFAWPALVLTDVYRLTWAEAFSGAFSYNRMVAASTPPAADLLAGLWHEPVPQDLSAPYGVALAAGNGWLWQCTPSGVWQAPVAAASLDLDADVLEVEAWESPRGYHAQVVLRNDDGRYAQPGAGALAALRQGSEVRLSVGYRTSAGAEVSEGPACWVTAWEHQVRDGRAALVLHLAGAWELLAHWRAVRQEAWSAGQASLKDVLAHLLARVGLRLVVQGGSDTLLNHAPAFTVHPGESGATAVRRLLAMVPDVLSFRGATAYVKQPQEADPTDYEYGVAHAILAGSYTTAAAGVNRVQVYGLDAGTGQPVLLGESFAWDEMADAYARLRQVHDVGIQSQARAQERADAVLQQVRWEAAGDQVRVPVNAGQELYDVVEVTEPLAGLSAARRRVLGLTLRWRRQGRAEYTHTLALGPL